MKEKLKIARKLRDPKKEFGEKNIELKKICSKCWRSYVYWCIIRRKKEFKIIYGEKYMYDFSTRFVDWMRYLSDYFESLFFGYDWKPTKPMHLKTHKAVPNEMFLENFLKMNGFEVFDERIESLKTVYSVRQI